MSIYNFGYATEGPENRFATDEEFKRASIVAKENSPSLERASVVMMDMGEGEVAMGKEELHSFVIGESGCGKTRRIVIPTIDMVSRTRSQSMVIADPKGEIYEATAATLKKRGYKVYRFDLTDPSKSQKWNPLALIASLYAKGGDDETKGRLLLKEVIEVLKTGIHSENDAFWEQIAGDIVNGIALTILKEGKPEDLTFRNIEMNLRKIFDDLPQFSEYYDKEEDDSPVKKYLSALKADEDSNRTVYSLKIETKTMLSPFCADENILSLFDTNTIDVTTLGKEKVALFLILSDSSKAMYPVATVFIRQLYSVLLEDADSRPEKRLRVPVFFILDEFANFTRLPDIDCMLTAARSRNIRFMLVCQSMQQLNENYGDSIAEILMSNCRIWIYMNSRDITFLNRLSDSMGRVYTRFTNRELPLVSISKLQHMDEGEVIVLNDRCFPMIGYVKDYSEYCLLDKGGIKDDSVEISNGQEEERKPLDLMAIWADRFEFRLDRMDIGQSECTKVDFDELDSKWYENAKKYYGTYFGSQGYQDDEDINF